MNYSMDRNRFFSFKYCFYFNLVLTPVNLNIQLEMIIKFAQQNFERPIIKIICKIDQIGFKVDPKQLSDLLDFMKFQNYSVFYGKEIHFVKHDPKGVLKCIGVEISIPKDRK